MDKLEIKAMAVLLVKFILLIPIIICMFIIGAIVEPEDK